VQAHASVQDGRADFGVVLKEEGIETDRQTDRQTESEGSRERYRSLEREGEKEKETIELNLT
jgi:hypothetical protein